MHFPSFVIISVLLCLNACQVRSDEFTETVEKVEVSMEVSIRANNLTVFARI